MSGGPTEIFLAVAKLVEWMNFACIVRYESTEAVHQFLGRIPTYSMKSVAAPIEFFEAECFLGKCPEPRC